jgi:hypothetical protein
MKRLDGEASYAGQGELHGLLSVVGLTPTEFCQLVGIQPGTFYKWFGAPLHPLPIECLRYYGWTKNMAEYLRSIGQDPEKFKPQLPTKARAAGKYPRKKGDLVLERANEQPGDYSPWTARRERN